MKISVVITSFNRPDLLVQTINSFNQFNDYPIEDFIIIEDSGNEDMNTFLTQNYSEYHLILHEQNKGAYESIDEAYSHIKTPYVLHCEDDWLWYKGGFIEKSITVLKRNPKIMQVNLSNEQNMPIEPKIFSALNYEDPKKTILARYRLEGTDKDGYWHGFTCNPSVRSMAGYEETKPWAQYASKTDEGYFLALHEMKVGKRYFELGYRAAVLDEYYCKHIGIGRCTWHS